MEQETPEAREERLADLRQRQHERIEQETDDERQERLQYARQLSQQTRQGSRSNPQHSKFHYLHQKGWTDSTQKLHEQPWVVDAMQSFHQMQSKWDNRLCTVCHECWPTNTCLGVTSHSYVCTRCKRDKALTKLYSAANDMHPGPVPPELTGLTQVEEMLIARACPIMCVYRKHGGQRGYRGHVLNLPQDLQGFLDKLPSDPADLPVLVVRRHGIDNTYTDCTVRREKVLHALVWLKNHNPFYSKIIIDHTVLQRLPENGIPMELLSVNETQEEESTNQATNVSQANDDAGPPHQSHPEDEQTELSANSTSFLPLPSRECTEDTAIRSVVNGDDPLEWPHIAGKPINEFRTPGLATMAFPTLFPHGKGDPTNPGREREVSLTESFKHLMRYRYVPLLISKLLLSRHSVTMACDTVAYCVLPHAFL